MRSHHILPPPPPQSMPPQLPPHILCEYRIYEFNRRLASSRQQHMPDYEYDMPWWDGFISEFFDDDATLNIKLYEDRPRSYSK